MNKVRKIILSLIIFFLLIALSLSFSYAYFKTTENHNPTLVSIKISGNLILTNETRINLTGDKSSPISDGKALSSDLFKMTFDITNQMDGEVSYNLGIVPLLATTMDIGSIKYALYKTDEEKPTSGTKLSTNPVTLNGEIKNEINNKYSESPTTGYNLNDEYDIQSNETQSFVLYVWVDYNEDGNNNSQMNKVFDGIVAITSATKYDRDGLNALLDEKKADISSLLKLSTNQKNTIIDLTRNQQVDVTNIKDVFVVDLNKAEPNFINNMAFLLM